MKTKIYNLPFDLPPAGGGSGEDDAVIIRAYTAQCNSSKNKIMLHRNMINLLISGRKTIMRPEGLVTIHEGELVILPSGNCLTSEVLAGSRPFSSILLYFDNAMLADFLLRYDRPAAGATTTVSDQPFLIFKQDTFIGHYIDSLRLMLQSTAVSPAFKRVKLEELLLYLLEKDPVRLRSLATLSNNEGDLALRTAVESNICNPVTADELAFLCHSSLSTFKRNFKRIYGSSPQKWLLLRKLEIAAGLLQRPDQRPGLVYEQVGYENHSSFTQAFKKQYGLTPSAYQEEAARAPGAAQTAQTAGSARAEADIAITA